MLATYQAGDPTAKSSGRGTCGKDCIGRTFLVLWQRNHCEDLALYAKLKSLLYAIKLKKMAVWEKILWSFTEDKAQFLFARYFHSRPRVLRNQVTNSWSLDLCMPADRLFVPLVHCLYVVYTQVLPSKDPLIPSRFRRKFFRYLSRSFLPTSGS